MKLKDVITGIVMLIALGVALYYMAWESGLI
jgi:hypothetical protein